MYPQAAVRRRSGRRRPSDYPRELDWSDPNRTGLLVVTSGCFVAGLVALLFLLNPGEPTFGTLGASVRRTSEGISVSTTGSQRLKAASIRVFPLFGPDYSVPCDVLEPGVPLPSPDGGASGAHGSPFSLVTITGERDGVPGRSWWVGFVQ